MTHRWLIWQTLYYSICIIARFTLEHLINNVHYVFAGDQVSRKGAITGGYYDTRKSRLDLQSSIVELRQKLAREEQEYEELRDKLSRVEVEITALMSDMQKIETKNRKNK